MKVKDLLEMEVGVDVYDDVCEELAIAFDGPQPLTEAGKKKFAEVLEYNVMFHNNGSDVVCIVAVDDPDEKKCMRRLRKAKEFFESVAGYCAADDWNKWFLFG